jgi:hypothetical protein
MNIHPTVERMKDVLTEGGEIAILDILAEDVKFQPPTYYKNWTGRPPLLQSWDMLDMCFQISNAAE